MMAQAEILEKMTKDGRLDREAANRLWDVDLLALGAAADRVRRKLNPEPRVTYVIDRNINYTNVCVSGCRFCAFYRAPGAAGGYVLGWDELAAKLQELKDHGGSGVLLQGGLNPELGPDYYKKLIGCIRASGLAVHGFSPPEVVYWADQWSLTIREVIRLLMDAGLQLHPRRRRRNPGGPGAAEDFSPISATAPGGWRSWARPTGWA